MSPSLRSVCFWLPVYGPTALYKLQGRSRNWCQKLKYCTFVHELSSAYTDFVFLCPSLWISWGLWATCRGQCWCTEWVCEYRKQWRALFSGWTAVRCPFWFSFIILEAWWVHYEFFFLSSAGSEHADLRPVLLCLPLLPLWILQLLSPALLLQRWAPFLPLPLPAKVRPSAHTARHKIHIRQSVCTLQDSDTAKHNSWAADCLCYFFYFPMSNIDKKYKGNTVTSTSVDIHRPAEWLLSGFALQVGEITAKQSCFHLVSPPGVMPTRPGGESPEPTARN